MKEYSYGVCIYRIKDYSTEVLLVKAKGRNDWGFPKGKIDTNETIKDCAIRETFEEIGISIKKKYLEKYYSSNDKRKTIGIFSIDDYNIKNKKIVLSQREIKDCNFFKLDNNIITLIQPNQQKIMKMILNDFIKRKYFFKENND